MSPLLIGTIGFIAMILLALSGVPIFVALGLVGVVGLILTSGFGTAFGIVASLPFAVFANYGLAVIPLFFLMGVLTGEGGLTKDAFESAYKLIGRVRGGLAMATSIGSGFSAACMGSSVANAALFTRMALPEMLRYNYDKSFSLGCIASAGTFAIMIPPSIAFVVYGIVTGESIGKLLVAGIFPGILTVIIYLIGIWVICRFNPKLAPLAPIKFTGREKLRSTLGLWGIGVLFILVMGGIYVGLFTPSAGAAVGASGAFILALRRGKLTKDAMGRVAIHSVDGMSSLAVIIIGGFLLARFLVVSGFVDELLDLPARANLSPGGILVGVVILYLILGCLMDSVSMTVCTMPFIYPLVVTSLGYNGIWFGVIFTKLCEIGLLTPPVGFNLFIVAAAAGKGTTVADVVKGIWPFLLMESFVLVILILFPSISLYLPSKMYGR